MSDNIVQTADDFLTQMKKLIDNKIKNIPIIKSAIINGTNSNGSFNIYFPPDESKVFTNIRNQTPFNLKIGDSVEIIYPQGNATNCWICAKHSVSPESSLGDSNKVIFTKAAIGIIWEGSSVPYSQKIPIIGVNSSSTVEFSLNSEATAAQVAAYQGLSLQDGGQSENVITLLCYGKKNTIPINVKVKITQLSQGS